MMPFQGFFLFLLCPFLVTVKVRVGGVGTGLICVKGNGQEDRVVLLFLGVVIFEGLEDNDLVIGGDLIFIDGEDGTKPEGPGIPIGFVF